MDDSTCNRCNRCNRPLVGRQTKYCSRACANRMSMQAKAALNREQPSKLCDVEQCDKPARSLTADLCPMHYHRVYRNGTLERLELADRYTDVRGHRYGTLVVRERVGQQWLCDCDCGNTRLASAGDLNRTGGNNTCGVPGQHLNDFVLYHAAHERVRRERGPASAHRCTDCGGGAYHWSYDHADPNEIISDEERTIGMAYSLSSEHYVARCVSCHKRFDLARIHSTAGAGII